MLVFNNWANNTTSYGKSFLPEGANSFLIREAPNKGWLCSTECPCKQQRLRSNCGNAQSDQTFSGHTCCTLLEFPWDDSNRYKLYMITYDNTTRLSVKQGNKLLIQYLHYNSVSFNILYCNIFILPVKEYLISKQYISPLIA